MTPLTDEEPWTDDEIATLRQSVAEQYRSGARNPFAASFIATIDARDATIRNTQYLADKMSERVTALTTENRTLREALERIANDECDFFAGGRCAENCPVHHPRLHAVDALAASPVSDTDRLGDNQ